MHPTFPKQGLCFIQEALKLERVIMMIRPTVAHVLQELRQIMAVHGGNFEVYYSRQQVTHIICSNLPNAKIKALQKQR